MRLAIIVLLAAGCASLRPTGLDPQAEARGHELALKAALAHGGLARWTTLGGVRVRVRASGLFESGLFYPREADYLLDPARNRAVARFVTRRGREEWRYDGREASISLDGHCRGTEVSRKKVAGLLSNLLFWFGVPFKFLDQGAHVAEWRGQLYVTYRDVGETPDDWFLARLDARGRVASMVYVASALSKKLEFRTGWTGYRTFDGLEVATHREFGPRSRVLRGLAPPGVLDLSDVHAHLTLDDASFRTCTPE
jgi:hypothetical protein